jgi:hypothetical protein
MKKTLLFFLMAVFAFNALSQDCGVYHPTKVGSILTYTYFKKTDKPENTCVMTLTNKENTANGVKLDVSGVVNEKNGKEALTYTYTAWCDGQTFYIDMKSMLSSMSVKDLSGYKIESTNLQFPKNLTAGQQLPDASLKLSVEGPVSTGITTNITNRKVEGFESVTTTAGTFDCVKISYEYNSKVMFIKTSGKGIEWFALNIGTVKSETYDSKGKLAGTNILTNMK